MRVRFKMRLTPWAVTAPSWMDGPSRPRERPAPIPNMPAVSFTHKMLSQRILIKPKIAPLTWGMPEPAAKGSMRFSLSKT